MQEEHWLIDACNANLKYHLRPAFRLHFPEYIQNANCQRLIFCFGRRSVWRKTNVSIVSKRIDSILKKHSTFLISTKRFVPCVTLFHKSKHFTSPLNRKSTLNNEIQYLIFPLQNDRLAGDIYTLRGEGFT